MFLWRALKPADIVTAILRVKSAIKNDHEPDPKSLGASNATRVEVLAKPTIIVKSDKVDI